jgi:hypothetical protein
MNVEVFQLNDEDMHQFLKQFIISNELTFLAEGECFSVYDSKDSSKIIKIQKINGDVEKIKEVFYWTDFCIKNQNSNFIPKLDKVNIYKFKTRIIYIIEAEKLYNLPTTISNELKSILAPFVSKDIKEIHSNDLSNIIFNIKESNSLKKYIDENFYDFFRYLIKSIKDISNKQGDTSFNFDFHYKNIMMSQITNKLVIVDCFNCSSYELE